eukprot:177420_1
MTTSATSFWLKKRVIPVSMHEFLGKNSTMFEITALCGFSLFVAGSLLFETEKKCNNEGIKMATWQKVLFVISVGDIAAGAIANLTSSTSNFHANNDAGNARLNGFIFLSIHFLHATGIYYSCKSFDENHEEWNKSLFTFLTKCYIGQLFASSLTVYNMGFEYQRIIGWISSMLMMGNIILDKTMKRSSMKYIMCLYCMKLIYAFSVDHYGVYKPRK